MKDTIVQLTGVRKSFGSFVAVDGLFLSIMKGEFLTLLGPSGCGKTTTLRLIGGFEQPDCGRITLESVDMANVPPNKRDVNTVFQSYALFPHLSVWENVAFGLKMHGAGKTEIKERVGDALDLVQLTSLVDRKPRALSGGQQQRVALARALVCHPKVLLLDEPLASLDLQLRRRMQIELKQLQQRVGITFVFVTHDQEEALAVSDRIAVMKDGCIEQLSQPKDVYDNPSSRFVAEFIGETNIVEGRVEDVETEGSFLISTNIGPLWAASDRLRPINASLPTPGTTVSLSIRQERIRLISQGVEEECLTPSANRLIGECVEVTFMGSAVKVTFKSWAGGHIQALVPVGELAELPHVGDTFTLGFNPSDCTFFVGG